MSRSIPLLVADAWNRLVLYVGRFIGYPVKLYFHFPPCNGTDYWQMAFCSVLAVGSEDCFKMKMPFSSIGILIINIKRSHDRLVFIMGIHNAKMVFILKWGQYRWPLCVHGGRQWERDGSITMNTSCGLVAYQMKFYKYIPLLTSRYSYIVACLYGLTLRVPASYIYASRTWSSLCLHIYWEISRYFGYQSICYVGNYIKRQKQRLPLLPAIEWV